MQMHSNVAAKKRKYGPSEADWQSMKACSITRVNLGFAFTLVALSLGGGA